ncbi:MAG: Flp pilus assembly protein CpaB [Pseudomonadota bacterium]|nr:Flp pilus assembly protein CpaB [Pseudomonadota bacterium]
MSRRAILLLIAGIIAAFTAISVKNRLSQAPVKASAPAVVHVVIAKHDLTPGNFVQAGDLDWGPAPKVASPKGAMAMAHYLYEDAVHLSDFNGAVVRRVVHAGDPVPTDALMKAGEGSFLSVVLDPGMRAVSIVMKNDRPGSTGFNAGFISPGDHVDLIVTHRIKTSNGTGSSESVVSETFAHDIRVVAVDQVLDNPDNKPMPAKTITVEVTPRQAEEVAVASEMGTISVALRSLSAPSKTAGAPSPAGEEGGQGYTSGADLMQLKTAIVPHVQVIRGDKSETVEFYRNGQ